MVQMPKPEDRVTIKLGPVRYDSPKATRSLVQEVIDEQPPSGGGITEAEVQELIDTYQPVTGGAGYVVGIPPGTPFVYVPANLLEYPTDLVATIGGGTITTDYPELDYGDVFGFGTDTIVLVRNGGTASTRRVAAVNPVTLNSRIIIAPNVNMDGLFCTNSAVVLLVHTSSSGNKNIYACTDGLTFSTVSLAAPTTTGTWYLAAVGPDSTNDYIFAAWGRDTTNQVVVRTYDNAGVQQTSVSETLPTGYTWDFAGGATGARLFDVRNGSMICRNPDKTEAFVRTSAATTSTWYPVSYGGTDVTADSTYCWAANSPDLTRITVATGASTTYPGVLNDGTDIRAVNNNQICYTRPVVGTGGNPNEIVLDVYDVSGGYPGTLTSTSVISWDPAVTGGTNFEHSEVVVKPDDSKVFVAGYDVATSPPDDQIFLFSVT